MVYTAYFIYRFLASVFVMNGAEDSVNTTGGHFLYGLSTNKFSHHFALEHGIDTVDTVFCIHGLHTVVVVMNDVDDDMNATEVHVTVCCGYE